MKVAEGISKMRYESGRNSQGLGIRQQSGVQNGCVSYGTGWPVPATVTGLIQRT